MPIKNFEKYTNVFIETGSYLGDGIQKAINAGYYFIHSIEINAEKFNLCYDRFEAYINCEDCDPKIDIYFGDSIDKLPEVIKDINEPITFWLDGHFSIGDRLAGVPMKTLCPLMEELEIIKQHPIKNHVIMIDDMNCWNGQENIYHEGFDASNLRDKILQINPNYKITFIDGEQLDPNIAKSHGKILKDDILLAKS